MINELKEAFESAKKIIYEKKELMIDTFPVVHELEDGIVIKFFSKWEDSVYDNIKIKKIANLNDTEEKIFLGVIPKGIKIKARSNDYMECFILLDGQLSIDIEGDYKMLDPLTKICVEPHKKYSGESYKDSYFVLITKIF
jgi:hypothetical protein